MAHEHSHSEANGVGVLGSEPLADSSEEGVLVAAEAARGELIARSPVVDIGEEGLHFAQAGVEVLQLGEDEGVELVLLEVSVREGADERVGIVAAQHFFGK